MRALLITRNRARESHHPRPCPMRREPLPPPNLLVSVGCVVASTSSICRLSARRTRSPWSVAIFRRNAAPRHVIGSRRPPRQRGFPQSRTATFWFRRLESDAVPPNIQARPAAAARSNSRHDRRPKVIILPTGIGANRDSLPSTIDSRPS